VRKSGRSHVLRASIKMYLNFLKRP